MSIIYCLRSSLTEGVSRHTIEVFYEAEFITDVVALAFRFTGKDSLSYWGCSLHLSIELHRQHLVLICKNIKDFRSQEVASDNSEITWASSGLVFRQTFQRYKRPLMLRLEVQSHRKMKLLREGLPSQRWWTKGFIVVVHQLFGQWQASSLVMSIRSSPTNDKGSFPTKALGLKNSGPSNLEGDWRMKMKIDRCCIIDQLEPSCLFARGCIPLEVRIEIGLIERLAFPTWQGFLIPDFRASYDKLIVGLSTIGNTSLQSFGSWRKRVPKPAAGMTAFLTLSYSFLSKR